MEKRINQLIRKYKTNNPFEISSQRGIKITFGDLGNITRGLYYRKLRHRFIVIHEDLDFVWEQFVCAHELAHDILHPGLNRFWLDQHSLFNPGKFEQQANRFAFSLLAAGKEIHPGESLQEFCIRTGIPEEMQQYFYQRG